jgi:hypothetical protein
LRRKLRLALWGWEARPLKNYLTTQRNCCNSSWLPKEQRDLAEETARMVAQVSAVEAELAKAVRRDSLRVLVQAEVRPQAAFPEEPVDREAPAPVTKAAARRKEISEACPPVAG